jgi:hypothetical protein
MLVTYANRRATWFFFIETHHHMSFVFSTFESFLPYDRPDSSFVPAFYTSRNNARNPSCSKCRSFVSTSVKPSRRIVCIEMQSVRL